MLGSKRLTAFLFVALVLMIVTSTLAFNKQGQPSQPPGAPSQRRIDWEELRKRGAERRSHYPVVDYNAPEKTTDPEELARRKEKNKYFDNRSFVSKDPAPRITETDLILEGYYVPAFPIARSSLIISGEVLDSQAHLSNDKHGIYTELTVRVDEVINNSTHAHVAQGALITAEREGGIVQYANGHQRLYHLAGQGMPATGRKYVLFLKAIGQSHDYEILTGYELSPTGVVPIDESSQFQPYEGYGVDTFLNAIRTAITQAQQTKTNN